MGRNSSDSESPVRNHRSSRVTPPRRERSPTRHRENRTKPAKHTRSRSPPDRLTAKEIPSVRARSPGSRSPSPRSRRLKRDQFNNNNKDNKSSEKGYEKSHGKNRSPESRSESPRTRRLKRAQADKISEKGHERDSRKEKVLERDRKSRKDPEDDGSSKSRHAENHKTRRRSRSPPRHEGNNSKEGDHRNDDDEDSVARMKAAEEALETKEKQKPSFELSGKLAAETNRVKGVTLLFTEPPDARKPEIRWRLYVFKGGEVLNEPLYVHRQTCYLFGRERRVADIPTDHPSCSKQHAVLQYRQVEKEQPDGMLAKQIRPYIMDLGSTNGTFINDNRIEPERYYELMEKDTIKFGNSSREYVILHENSA